MANKTLYWLTGLLLGSVLILILINMSALFFPSNLKRMLPRDNVRGMAVEYKDKLWTLNFEQQNAIVDIVNSSMPIEKPSPIEGGKPPINKIVVYRFNGSDLEIIPLGYIKDSLEFSMTDTESESVEKNTELKPTTSPKVKYFREIAPSNIQKILSSAIDQK